MRVPWPPMNRRVQFLYLLALGGCTLARYSETPAGQPVYVLAQPLCVLVCASDFGSVRAGDGTSGLSLSQQSAAGAASP